VIVEGEGGLVFFCFVKDGWLVRAGLGMLGVFGHMIPRYVQLAIVLSFFLPCRCYFLFSYGIPRQHVVHRSCQYHASAIQTAYEKSSAAYY
jgi:hypothetical protein